MTIRPPATARQLSKFGSSLTLAAGAVLSLASGVASAQAVNFQGNTDGCFGMACAPVSGTTSLDGITYRDSTFNVTTVDGFIGVGGDPGVPNVNNLGSLSVSGSPFGYGGDRFELTVNFTTPPGTSPTSTVFTSLLTGTVVSADNGGVFFNFDNTPRNFVYTGGTFTFQVNDLSVTGGKTGAISGNIVVSAIPEPETYALMMAGLGALGFMARRRKKA